MQTVIDELTTATNDWLEIAKALFGSRLTLNSPKISIELNGGVGGIAYYRDNLIKYNPQLYVHNKIDYINQTVPHELAHLIAHALFGYCIKPHGKEWKWVMAHLGLKPTRCHSYDMTVLMGKYTRPFVYKCSCREFQLTKTLHNRIQAGNWRTCQKCKKCLEFVKKV